MPASAIFMGVYEPVKQHIARKVPENRQYLAALGGGALAGFAASFVRVPTEVVKQRLQTGELVFMIADWPSPYLSLFDSTARHVETGNSRSYPIT